MNRGNTRLSPDENTYPAHSNLADCERRLITALALTLVYLSVEVVAGFLTGSLSLLADAVHMLTDAGGLGLALFAVWISQKSATRTKTYGYYRWEVLAALINAVVLLGSGALILAEAYRRFREPADVIGLPMLVVAVIGLFVNLVGMRILHPEAGENLNIEGAFMEMAKDTLGSLGVIVAAVIIWITGWNYADPIASVLISLLILPRTWRLLNQSVNILLEGVPPDVNVPDIEATLSDIEGVSAVHDIHVWAISSELVSLSSHVVLQPGLEVTRSQQILEEINRILKTHVGIEHTTIQLEHRNLARSEPRL
ncbi:MAG: cation transporter [Chloroflexi bacterium]|nr:cation transporter [Chloroflexota bacterium]